LEAELERDPLSGFHDLERWAVRHEAVDMDIVGLHEAHHDRALTETPFGLAQMLFRRVTRLCTDGGVQAHAAAWTKELLDASRSTHERWATYLSVKTLPADRHQEALRLHPQEYLAYYDGVARIVDPALHSSFLQFIVGMVLLEVCLSPRLLERLCAEGATSPAAVHPDEAPDHRFGTLADTLTPATVNDLARVTIRDVRDCARSLGLPGTFNPQVEEHWTALPLQTALRLERSAELAARGWLYDEACRGIPCLRRHECIEALRHFVRQLEDMATVELGAVLQWARGHHDSLNATLATRALRAGVSCVSQRPVVDVEAISHVDNEEDLRQYLSRIEGDAMLITSRPDCRCWEDLQWVLLADAGDSAYAISLTHDVLRGALQRAADIAAPERRLGGMPVIIGIDPAGGSFFQALHNHMRRLRTVGDAVPKQRHIVWYMGYDFFVWYSFLSREGVTEWLHIVPAAHHGSSDPPAYPAQITTVGDANHFRQLREPGFRCYVFRNPRVCGVFVRWFPVLAHDAVSVLLMDDLEAGHLQPLPQSDRKTAADAARATHEAIRIIWPEY